MKVFHNENYNDPDVNSSSDEKNEGGVHFAPMEVEDSDRGFNNIFEIDILKEDTPRSFEEIGCDTNRKLISRNPSY
jgi:hypothetical protein